jgi:type VI secretion system protein VasD
MPGSKRLVVSLVTATLLHACGSAAPPLLQGSIKANQGTNPDRNGRSSPIVVRIYELRSAAAFNGAEFFSLFDRESETLGSDLVGREEYTVSPAETRPYKRQLQPDTKFIGVVAAFRDLENSRWRDIAAVPAGRESTIAIGVDARALTVTVGSGESFFARHSPFSSKDAAPAAKDAPPPAKDASPTTGALPTKPVPIKDLLSSPNVRSQAKERLLAQTNDMIADLVAMNSSGKLTSDQAKQVSQLLPQALALKGQVDQLGIDPVQATEVGNNVVDLLKQVNALKDLVK